MARSGTIGPRTLFADGRLSELLSKRAGVAKEAAATLQAADLAKGTDAEIASEIVREMRPAAPKLDLTTTRYEQLRDVSWHEPDLGRRIVVRGREIPIVIEFGGDPDLFLLTPSHFKSLFPTAEVRGRTIRFTYRVRDASRESIRPDFDSDVERVEFYLDACASDIDQWAHGVAIEVEASVARRRASLASEDETLADLGIPRADKRNPLCQ